MQRLLIGLSSWIIQDGNYPDFHVGREYRFALEFYPHEVTSVASDGRRRDLTSLGDALYEVQGVVVFQSREAWVADFGVPAYREETPPEFAVVSAAVSGRVYLGVDPFFYFERLSFVPGMPDLYRTWSVHRIHHETTPWIEAKDVNGRPVKARDESRRQYEEVAATDAFKDPFGHYLLECELRTPGAV